MLVALIRLFLLVETCSVLSAGQEILRNSDFEQNIDGSNWQCLGCTGVAVSDSYQGRRAYLASNRAQYWNGPSQNLYLGRQPNQVIINSRYSFSCFVKLGGIVNKPQDVAAVIKYSFADGHPDQYDGFSSIEKLTIDGKWHKMASDFQIKDYGHPLKSPLLLYISNPEPGVNILIDKCSVTSLDSSDWKEAARQRIERLRKGDLTVNIQANQPLRNVVVNVKQLKHQFGFGSAVGADYLEINSQYRKWYLDNFEWAVLENDMKWRQNELVRNKLTFDKPDKAMKILEDNDKKVRGHAIFWAANERNPDWLQKMTNKRSFHDVCMKRIDDVVSHYRGRLEHWDVNNEMSNHRFYVDKYGSDSIRADMFRKARSVDQSAKLFMNDYNLVAGGYNLQGYIKQAQSFMSAKVPLDGLGAQGHFNGRPSGPAILDRLDRLAVLGLPIWITELDYANSNDQERADGLEDALLAFFSHQNVGGVLFWGFYEGKHWRGKEAALVNGKDMKPNAAGKMWQRLFHTDWRSNIDISLGSLKAGEKVSSKRRVFYGRYEISVSIDGVNLHTEKVSVSKGQPGILNIQLSQNVVG